MAAYVQGDVWGTQYAIQPTLTCATGLMTDKSHRDDTWQLPLKLGSTIAA